MQLQDMSDDSMATMIRTKRANGKADGGLSRRPKCRRTVLSGPVPGGARTVRLRTGVGGDARWLRLAVRVCALGLAWAAPAQVPEPDPRWEVPGARVRQVFPLPNQLRYCLVLLPSEVSPGRPLAGVRAMAGDREIPSRIVHVDGDAAAVMLNATYVAAGSPVAVYALDGEVPVVPATEGPLDPAPLLGEVRRVVGQDYPKTWAEHQFQRRRMQEPFRTFRAVSFDHAERESNPRQWRREEWSRSGYCIELSTWVRIPETGTYRFAAKGENSVFLLWGAGAEPMVETTSEDRRWDDEGTVERPWVAGREVRLEAGVYPLRLVQVSRRFANARAGWIPPGGTEPVEIPLEWMLSGQRELPVPRSEALDRIVQASFDASVQPGYRFRGVREVFAPVSLTASSVDWSGGELQHRWTVDGQEVGTDAVVTPVLRAGSHRVELVSYNGTGFEGRVVREVTVPAVAVEEYRLAGSLQGVPSVCYDSDRVWPDLWVTGSLPSEIRVRGRLLLRDLDGRTQSLEEDVALDLGWGRLRGSEQPVGPLAEIAWEIEHGGVVLARQEIRFLRQPFSAIPDHVVGNELLAGGERIVLVVRRVSREGPPNGADGLPLRIVCLDSTLAPPGWYAGGEESAFSGHLGALAAQAAGNGAPSVVRLNYEALNGSVEGSLRTLAPLGGLAKVRRGDVVVASLGLEAYVDREPVGAFERRVAALCGLLLEAVGAEVVLATPPPLGDDRTAIRPYAEAVLRVADAYGLEVADLYSAFGGHARPARLYDGLRVTGEGQMLAAGVVARALRRHGSLRDE